VTGELRRSRFPYQIVRMDVPSVANISSLIIDVYALLGVFNFVDGVGHRPDNTLASTREAGCMSVCVQDVCWERLDCNYPHAFPGKPAWVTSLNRCLCALMDVVRVATRPAGLDLDLQCFPEMRQRYTASYRQYWS
jgi:hypothetical protein